MESSPDCCSTKARSSTRKMHRIKTIMSQCVCHAEVIKLRKSCVVLAACASPTPGVHGEGARRRRRRGGWSGGGVRSG